MVCGVLGPELPVDAWLSSDDGAIIGAGPRFATTIVVALLLIVVLGVP